MAAPKPEGEDRRRQDLAGGGPGQLAGAGEVEEERHDDGDAAERVEDEQDARDGVVRGHGFSGMGV